MTTTMTKGGRVDAEVASWRLSVREPLATDDETAEPSASIVAGTGGRYLRAALVGLDVVGASAAWGVALGFRGRKRTGKVFQHRL